MTQTGALGWDGWRPQGNLWERGLQEHTSAHWFLALHTQLFANESVPDHVGYAKVKITLINENDNRPIFSQPLYNVSLYENVTVGTSVLTVLPLAPPAFTELLLAISHLVLEAPWALLQPLRAPQRARPGALAFWTRRNPLHPPSHLPMSG